MPRFYKRPPGTKPRKLYNDEDLKKAIDEVQCGRLTLRAASEKYGVDKMKIYRCIKKLHQKQLGGQTTLTAEEEAILVGRSYFIVLYCTQSCVRLNCQYSTVASIT